MGILKICIFNSILCSQQQQQKRVIERDTYYDLRRSIMGIKQASSSIS